MHVLDHNAASCALLQEEAASVSQQREQLVLAEKLFGMDITGYPDLVQVCCRKQRVSCASASLAASNTLQHQLCTIHVS